jgi:hypothetical protein
MRAALSLERKEAIMSFQQLRCMITANDGRRFLFTDEEIERFVEHNDLHDLLWDRELFYQCGKRLLKDSLPAREVRIRLYAAFGRERIRSFLGS